MAYSTKFIFVRLQSHTASAATCSSLFLD